MNSRLTGDPVAPRKKNPNISPGAEEIVLHAMARKPEDRLTQREMDLAASVQAVTEEVVLKLAQGIADETGDERADGHPDERQREKLQILRQRRKFCLYC